MRNPTSLEFDSHIWRVRKMTKPLQPKYVCDKCPHRGEINDTWHYDRNQSNPGAQCDGTLIPITPCQIWKNIWKIEEINMQVMIVLDLFVKNFP